MAIREIKIDVGAIACAIAFERTIERDPSTLCVSLLENPLDTFSVQVEQGTWDRPQREYRGSPSPSETLFSAKIRQRRLCGFCCRRFTLMLRPYLSRLPEEQVRGEQRQRWNHYPIW